MSFPLFFKLSVQDSNLRGRAIAHTTYRDAIRRIQPASANAND